MLMTILFSLFTDTEAGLVQAPQCTSAAASVLSATAIMPQAFTHPLTNVHPDCECRPAGAGGRRARSEPPPVAEAAVAAAWDSVVEGLNSKLREPRAVLDTNSRTTGKRPHRKAVGSHRCTRRRYLPGDILVVLNRATSLARLPSPDRDKLPGSRPRLPRGWCRP